MKEIIGLGAASNLLHLLKNKKQMFLVTSDTVFGESGIKHHIANSNINTTAFAVSGKLVTDKEVKKAVKAFNKERETDVLVAVGGGKVIDTAKMIRHKTKSSVTFIAIPTTAGSGSEATRFAAMYVKGKKTSVVDDRLLPDYSIVDPGLLYSLTKEQVAISGLDALAQGIESFWSIKSTNLSKSYSIEAVDLVFNNLKDAYDGDKRALGNLSVGAHLAGKAINIAETTVCHALSYYFTSRLGVPHGYAVALTLPSAIKIHCREDKKLALEMNRLFVRMKANSPEEAADGIELLMREIGLDPRNEDIVKNKYVYEAVDQVNEERLANNPIQFKHKRQGLRPFFAYK
jgi:alcohol dehydrogenase class IV